MATVLVNAVYLILIVLHNPTTCHEINRTLCLETAFAFVEDHNNCNFDKEYAENNLDDKYYACQTKCEVKIENINKKTNVLWEVEITFGNAIYKYVSPCAFIKDQTSLTMFIDCKKWNEVKVQVGGYCKQNEQCQGSEHWGACKHGRCVCRDGYVLHNLECYEENLPLNNTCSFSEQCAESPYASCLAGKCSCIDIDGHSSDCNQIKVPIGGFCMHDKQCQGNDYSGVCDQGICVCGAGYILFNLQCHEGNLPLNNTCSFSEQCAGSPSASCLGGNCSCIEGYTAQNSTNCVQNKVPVGGYCKHGAQCRGSNYSVECELERCVCRAGYVLIDFECKEGNLALNQSCASIEQCAGSPYASCLGGKCSCLEGYTPENSTDCVQIQKSSLPNSLHPQANTGSIFGALFGGLLIGVIFTTAAGAIIYRRSHTNFKKRGELNVFDNDSYANVVHQNDLQIVKTKDKTRELHAISCLGGTSVYSLSSEKPSDRQKQDTVYNHLHEQVKRDDTDYYDHACAVPAYNEDMGDYSHLHQFTS